MKIREYAVLILCLACNFCFSQDNTKSSKRIFFQTLELSVPFKGNENYNSFDENNNQNKNWFVPDGIFTKAGIGIHYNKWIGIGVNSGLDWKATDKMVAIPVYANLRIAPKIDSEDTITLQLGYGKAFVLGRGAISGVYKKISLGIEKDSSFLIFLELSEYDVQFSRLNKISAISLGVTSLLF